MIDYIGYLSATLSSLAFAPQAIKTIKTKNTDGISLITYALFNLGIVGWLSYGILLRDWPIILANGVTLVFSLTILFLKIKHS